MNSVSTPPKVLSESFCGAVETELSFVRLSLANVVTERVIIPEPASVAFLGTGTAALGDAASSESVKAVFTLAS